MEQPPRGNTSVDESIIDVLIIDGANVVGSRPDGWWNDRAGAAARLHARLLDASLPATTVVLVLEGRSRSGVPEQRTGTLQVVHAAGEGDDTIVAEARRAAVDGTGVAVVTADRDLSARVAAVDVRVLRPGWLLGLLDAGSSAR